MQISANAAAEDLLERDFGRDRSRRPYMRETLPERGMLLTEAYISLGVNRPSLTALQRVGRDGQARGLLGANFDLRGLPLTRSIYQEPSRWQQLKGDPDICLAYAHHAYPEDAEIPAADVGRVFERFRRLRYGDDIIYLRSGSLKIFNGIVALNFSCDGSHYLPHGEFLDPGATFWQSIT